MVTEIIDRPQATHLSSRSRGSVFSFKFLISLALAVGVVFFNRLQSGVGFLWGDDFLVVNHFGSSDGIYSALKSGILETGQGKWRPLTYLLISIFSFVFGTNFIWWTLLSIVALAGVLLSIWVLIESLNRALQLESFDLANGRVRAILPISVGFVVWTSAQPMFWYTFSSPFAIMELGALGSSVLVAQILVRAGGEPLSDREFTCALMLSLTATLFHERFFVLLVGLSFVMFLQALKEGSNTRKKSELCTSLFWFWRAVARTWVSGFIALFYLALRVNIPNSKLLSSGGELGIESTFGGWIIFRPIIMLSRATYGGGEILHFDSGDGWIFPKVEDLNLFWLAELLLIVVVVLLALFYLPKDGNFRLKRLSQLGYLWPLLVPVIGGCLVAERIEPRWWMGARLWLCLSVLFMILFIQNVGSKVLVRCVTGVAAILLVASSISSQEKFFRSPRMVSEVLHAIDDEKETSGIHTSLLEEVVVIPPGETSGSFAWSLGYGGVIRSHLGLDKNFPVSFGGNCAQELCLKVRLDS